jgi:hypothetical protein
MSRQRKIIPTKDIFLAGQLHGLVMMVNPAALEEYLANEAERDGFRYGEICRSVIAFAKAVQAVQKQP